MSNKTHDFFSKVFIEHFFFECVNSFSSYSIPLFSFFRNPSLRYFFTFFSDVSLCVASCTLYFFSINVFFFVFFSESELRREISRLGTTTARLKPKGIDGGLHKRWSMWFNSKQRAKPYQSLTYEKPGCLPALSLLYRCCMAVVSSWCELLG